MEGIYGMDVWNCFCYVDSLNYPFPRRISTQLPRNNFQHPYRPRTPKNKLNTGSFLLVTLSGFSANLF